MVAIGIVRFPDQGRSYAVRRTPRRGRGVFTQRGIEGGEVILKFGGDVMTVSEIDDFTHVLEIDVGIFLGPSGEADDYINHSCEPNCAVFIDSGEAYLVAVRPIGRGEELTFDYSTVLVTDPTEFPCGCSSPACRRRITAFPKLPAGERQRLLEQGLVPEFAVRAASGPPPESMQGTGTD